MKEFMPQDDDDLEPEEAKSRETPQESLEELLKWLSIVNGSIQYETVNTNGSLVKITVAKCDSPYNNSDTRITLVSKSEEAKDALDLTKRQYINATKWHAILHKVAEKLYAQSGRTTAEHLLLNVIYTARKQSWGGPIS